MQFTQHIVIHAQEDALLELMQQWKEDADAAAPGMIGGRVLRFRDKPGRYVIQADFESWDAAQVSNQRPQTQAWAAKMNSLIEGEPKYEDLDVLIEF